jgi:hypothetical protein
MLVQLPSIKFKKEFDRSVQICYICTDGRTDREILKYDPQKCQPAWKELSNGSSWASPCTDVQAYTYSKTVDW